MKALFVDIIVPSILRLTKRFSKAILQRRLSFDHAEIGAHKKEAYGC